jgi:3-oxoacyl-[acyl-carrier protein] reductase
VSVRIAEKVATGISSQEAMLEIAGDNPMRRMGDARELAELVLFLVGSRARFLTSSHIPVDGGANGFSL